MAGSGLTWAVLAGATAGLGVTVIMRELLPAQPQLAAALDRLAPARVASVPPTAQEPAGEPASTSGLESRVGRAVQRHLPKTKYIRNTRRQVWQKLL